MMLLLIRLTSLRQLLLDTKVKTLLSLPRLLELLVLKLIRRFVMEVMLRERRVIKLIQP
ncbi:hypothetical protein ANAPC1_01067 [Anaplasma phagocytophilum]|uniref:Uncharacterized protein n=1 Tax=Anaplasma phagocytophilum TaxID=948 RepID=A0AA45UTR4_ANAPH|nr:hypothetical protein ANAPC1_01057 [Anaplasma phagocytophilum]SBO14704.1 hypothetical protein ANAPC1_01067 [Anaplasma phagocytophilum]SBO33756.1 hypothetical protein ANAPC2_01448 [Anaplasma phagocytophilum]SBO33999.1 hypothetical protein ANAPC4_01437 [Anaplasma phagocytophilum]